MKSISLKIFLLGFLMMGVASLTHAQGWPKPAKTPRTDLLCDTNACKDAGTAFYGKKIIGYPPLLTTFSGRFLDSTVTRDYQFSFRTARTRGIRVAQDRNRIYMIIGSAIAAYDLETFFTRLEGGEPLMPSTQVQVSPPNSRSGSPEVFLNWDRFFYAESGGGWAVPQGDGQERLFGFDWDDRGLVYLAYGAFSWGVVRDDGGKGGAIMPTIYQDTDAHDPQMAKAYDLVVSALTIISLKGSNGSYYAIVSGSGNGKSNVYDVSGLSAGARPIRGSNLPFEFAQYAKSSDGSRVGIVKADGALAIYDVDSLVRGGAPLFSVPGNSERFGGVTSDGTNFYASSYSQANGLRLSVYKPSGGTYSQTLSVATGLKYNGAPTIRFGGPQSGGSQFLTVVGVDLAAVGFNARLYKIGANAESLQEVTELENYVAKHYSSGAPAGYTGANYSYLYDVTVHRSEKTKKYYMIVGNFGLGDVYELRAGESIKASIKNKQRLANPNSQALPDSGPYYGDEITFTSQTSNAQPPVSWTFSDGGFANATATNPDVRYQFGGVNSAALLPATRQVTATSLLDTSLVDTLPVSLKKPEVRIGLKGTSYLFKQPDASSPVPIVSSDFFQDASDGSIEGHYSEWKRDNVAVLSLPNEDVSVGTCGVRTLYFTGHYGPYAGTAPNITPMGSPADLGINGITYASRAVAAAIAEPVAAGTNVTFNSATRATTNTADLAAGTVVSYTWELLRGDLSPAMTPVTGSSAPASIPAFTVPKSLFQGASNWRVRLTVSVPTASLSAACQPFAVTKADSRPLSGPAVTDLTVSGCANAGSPCTLTPVVPAGTDTTGWIYAWSVTGPAAVSSGSSATYSPAFVAGGTYTVTLVASNAIGSATASKQLSVAAPLCASSPATALTSIGFTGNGSSRCSSSTTPCAPGESVTFAFYPYGWQSGSCDTYLWNFGDGGTSTAKSPTHTFNSPGTYQVTLRITGGLNAADVPARTVVVGSSAPPPPPPPTGCSAMVAEQNVYITYTGSGGCSTAVDCKTSENVVFAVQSYGYNMNCGQHSFQWSFSDGGTSSASSVAHAFGTAGTHSVSVTVNNGVNAVTLNKAVKVVTGTTGGGSCPSMAAGGNVFIGYTGAQSNCTASSGACKVAENINFTAGSFGYNYGCGAHTYSWTFGDGGTSSAQNPTHIFSSSGTYNVKLTIKNSQQEVTMEKLVSVGGSNPVEPTVTIDFSHEKQSSDPKLVKFTPVANPASSVATYQWDFGDGSSATSSTAAPQFHMYAATGTYNVTVTAKSASGASLATQTHSVDVGVAATTRRRAARH